MINAIAVDKDSSYLSKLQKLCDRTDFIRLKKTFSSIETASKHFRKFPVDLVLVDIEMCLDAGKKIYLNKTQEKTMIFTSRSNKYATEAFNMNALDFLIKPLTNKRFEVATKKAFDYFTHLRKESDCMEEKLRIRAD